MAPPRHSVTPIHSEHKVVLVLVVPLLLPLSILGLSFYAFAADAMIVRYDVEIAPIANVLGLLTHGLLPN